MKNPSESDQLALKVFEGLQPFTITVNNGADAMYLSLALLNGITGDTELTNEAMRLLVRHAKLEGVQASIDHFFNHADNCGIDYPEFIKPIMILMITHMFDNKEKIKGLVDNEEAKE